MALLQANCLYGAARIRLCVFVRPLARPPENSARWMARGSWKLRRRTPHSKFGELRIVWRAEINATDACEFVFAQTQMRCCLPNYSPSPLSRVLLGSVSSCAACRTVPSLAGRMSCVDEHRREPWISRNGKSIGNIGVLKLWQPKGPFSLGNGEGDA